MSANPSNRSSLIVDLISVFILLSPKNERSTQQVVRGIVASNCRSCLTLGSCEHALKAAMAVDGLSWVKLLIHLVSHIINILRREVGFGRSRMYMLAAETTDSIFRFSIPDGIN